MRELKIYRQFFTNSACYKSGIIQTPKGVQVHSTGANNSYLHRYVGPDDGRLGPNQYDNTHNRPDGTVCANAYIGRLQDGTPAIYQTLPWDMRCWLSANGDKGNANKMGYIGFEICEDNRKNREYFNQVVMGLSVDLVAYLCLEYNIPLSNVLDHSELHKKGIGSDHGDISWWLVNFGYNMNDYRLAVQKAMEEGVTVKYIEGEEGEQEVMYNAKVVAKSGSTVNMRLSASQSAAVVAKVPVGTTVEVTKQVNATWSQIVYQDKTGYMMTEFLDKIQEVSDGGGVDKSKLKTIRAKLEEAIKLIDELL